MQLSNLCRELCNYKVLLERRYLPVVDEVTKCICMGSCRMKCKMLQGKWTPVAPSETVGGRIIDLSEMRQKFL